MIDSVEEIKARLPIEELVRPYVQLKKAGRSLKGLCPFHAEKTPSFIVSPDRGIAYCFGCHKGGDIFRFMQEIEGVDFVDALKILAERTGVELKQERPSFRPAGKDEKEQLLHIHELATSFYERCLWNTDDGAKVLGYLRRRGLKDETIRSFRIGFAPESFETTYTMLLKEGFTRKILVSSGIAQSRETTVEKIYDRFRGRLIFPILDHMGRVVAFGGRALKKDQEPKYLNSPETVIYHKSNVLYGFSKAKSVIKAKNATVLVEGYMDMIAAFQAGVENAVATSGTALTSQQLRLLQPFAETLYLSFDMDSAGQDAARRAYDLVQDYDFQVKVVELPEGKDIAEFAQNNAEKLPEVIAQAKLYGDYFYHRLFLTYGTADVHAKRKILQDFFPFISQLRSTIEKDAYVRKLAHDLNLQEKQIYDELKNLKLPVGHPARTFKNLDPVQPVRKKMAADELFLGFLIEFPRIAGLITSSISEEYFSTDLKPIYKHFADQYNGQGVQEGKGFLATLPYEHAEKASLLSLYISEVYGEIGEEAVEHEMKVLLDKIIKDISNTKREELGRKVKEAEDKGEKEEYLRLLREIDDLHLKAKR